ncbi:MAG TPA: class A beta-lactamase [Thermoanaerobaculia bacterium]|jgi:beta-lactamase class A
MRAFLLMLTLLAPAEKSRDVLEQKIRTIAESAGGTVGVSILHVESGRGASVRGGEALPMASVFKLPVAYELLRRADRGAVRLDQRIALAAADLRTGQSPIAERAPHGGITLSIGELLEAMLVDGDNTAADLLLPLAGGPEVVTAQLDEAGLGGIRVDRSEAELAFDTFGATPPPRASWSLATLRAAFDAVPEARRREAFDRFLADPRDTATADALALLLRDAQQGRRLSPESHARLLALLGKTRTGPARLKGALPPGTPVAHRTGTGGDFGARNVCTNDAGILTLPGNRGHLVVAVLIRGSDRPLAEREKAIARIARAAWDHWNR